jgi:hypothetical protein
MMGGDDYEDTFAGDKAFDPGKGMLQHGAATNDSAELFDTPSATESLQKGAHACAFISS